jgi:hypothetical protein
VRAICPPRSTSTAGFVSGYNDGVGSHARVERDHSSRDTLELEPWQTARCGTAHSYDKIVDPPVSGSALRARP